MVELRKLLFRTPVPYWYPTNQLTRADEFPPFLAPQNTPVMIITR